MDRSPDGGLAAAPDSGARPVAEALTWLWRLGPVGDVPHAGAIALGTVAEVGALAAAVRSGAAAGAIVLVTEPGAEDGPLPERRLRTGTAGFASGARVHDDYIVFGGGRSVVRTRVGDHAVLLGDRVLAVGADLAGRWGYLGAYWALSEIEEFAVEVLARPLLKLPAIGSVRLDDVPGTIQLQLEGRAKGDDFARKRVGELHRDYRRAGGKLSVAVPARAMHDGEPVPLEQVWPQGVAALRAAIEDGTFESVCHGWLHYDAQASGPGRVEPREFLDLDEAEAGRRIDAAIAWQTEQLGAPGTFVAPAWGYSDGARAALASRGLPAWHRAAPEPLIVDGNPRETLIGAGAIRGGVYRLDYGSLRRLADAGLPPTPVLHGSLLDDRRTAPIASNLLMYARLTLKRDSVRLPEIGGVRWLGAAELVERYRDHDESEVLGREAVLPDGAEAVLRDADGSRVVRG